MKSGMCKKIGQVENWPLAKHKVIWDVQELLLTLGNYPSLVPRPQRGGEKEHRFSVPQIADMFEVSVNELDRLVREIQYLFPMCGNRQMQGQLLAHGVRIQQYHIRETVNEE